MCKAAKTLQNHRIRNNSAYDKGSVAPARFSLCLGGGGSLLTTFNSQQQPWSLRAVLLTLVDHDALLQLRANQRVVSKA